MACRRDCTCVRAVETEPKSVSSGTRSNDDDEDDDEEDEDERRYSSTLPGLRSRWASGG